MAFWDDVMDSGAGRRFGGLLWNPLRGKKKKPKATAFPEAPVATPVPLLAPEADVRQQFLDLFVGPEPQLPDRGSFIAPYEQAASGLQSTYDASRRAIQAQLPELQAQLAAIQQRAQQLASVASQQSAGSQQAVQQSAQGNTAAIQARLAALGGNGEAIAAQAGNQQVASQQAQANRDAFVQRQQIATQGSDAQRAQSVTQANASSLGALDAAKLKAQSQIGTQRAQAEAAFAQMQAQAEREAYNRRLGAASQLDDFEARFNPVDSLRMDASLDDASQELALSMIQSIEAGESTLAQELAQIKADPIYVESGADVAKVEKALRKAYQRTRVQREKALRGLQKATRPRGSQ